jgi:hypothetical protein
VRGELGMAHRRDREDMVYKQRLNHSTAFPKYPILRLQKKEFGGIFVIPSLYLPLFPIFNTLACYTRVVVKVIG